MEIEYFKVNDKEIDKYLAATGEKLKLSWKCNGCDACIIYPYNWKGKPEGNMEVCVYQPMTFLLRAYNKEEGMQKEISVEINGKEQLESVRVSPQGPVQAGEETTFEFSAANTNYGYLDHGIGRVEGNSYTQLLKDNYSVYRYSILSRSTGKTAFQEQDVKAGRRDALALDRLKYVLMRDGDDQTYQLDWRIVNHCEAEVIIKVFENQSEDGAVYKGASGNEVFTRKGGNIRTLSIQCKTKTEKINFSSIYPFEIK